MKRESIKLLGEYRFTGIDTRSGKTVCDRRFSNVITYGCFGGILQFLNWSSQTAGALNVTHVALGTGTDPAERTDTALRSEQFRKQLTTRQITQTHFQYRLILAPAEANFAISEVGTFANANDTSGSGLLLSRANADIIKNSNTQYLITFRLTLG